MVKSFHDLHCFGNSVVSSVNPVELGSLMFSLSMRRGSRPVTQIAELEGAVSFEFRSGLGPVISFCSEEVVLKTRKSPSRS